MSTDKKAINQVFDQMWEEIVALRGSADNLNYKLPVLYLFFLKYLDDKFHERRKVIEETIGSRHIDNPTFYTGEGVPYLHKESRWEEVREKEGNILVNLDQAFAYIEEANLKTFKDVFKKDCFTSKDIGLDPINVKSLMDVIVNTDSSGEGDFLGKVYQYLLNKFAIKGDGNSEFYTPQSIVKLMVSLIEPFEGNIYDPCCGSGGMFVQATEMVKNIQFGKQKISIYGQELSKSTYGLCKMNLAMRGIIDSELGEPKCTLKHDQHPTVKVDYVLSNPPFNLSKWREENSLEDDPRWAGYEVPPASNANYAWILHILDKLSQNGVAGVLLANKSLDATGKEEKIRKKLIESDLIEAIITLPRKTFYNTDIAVTLWIINRNKKARELKEDRKLRDRTNQILFVDARELGSVYEKSFVEFTEEDIALITKTFHSWRYENYPEKYEDKDGFCKSISLEELKSISPEYSLFPNTYIPFKAPENTHDWNAEIMDLAQQLTQLFKEESQLKSQVEGILSNPTHYSL